MAVPIARHLVEFPLNGRGRRSSDERPVVQTAAKPALSLSEQLADAFERGREEGRAAAQADLEAALAAERVNAEERLAAERRSWTVEVADRLAAGIETALQQLTGEVAGAVARILTPFVAEKLRERTVGDLAETLAGLFADGRSCLLRVTGPDDLLRLLRDKLAAHSGAIDFVTGECPDIRVLIGDAVLETQLQPWAERLRRVSE